MYKPLDLPLRVRLWHFVRGLLFYNTVYWKRASDVLNPPRLSRKERQLHQPSRDLAIIRPREHPRAGIVAAHDSKGIIPPVAPTPPPTHVPAGEELGKSSLEEVGPEQSVELTADDPGGHAPEVIVKRRRYRRRRNKVSALPSPGMTAPTGAGLLGRLFNRDVER